MSFAKVITHNTKWLYISKIACQLISLFATVLVIRKLPVDIFGTYNLLLGSLLVMEIVAVSAVSNVFNRYVPELISNKQYSIYKRLIVFGFICSTLLSSVLAVVLYFYKDLFSSFFHIPQFDKYLFGFIIYCYAHFLQKLIEACLKSLLLHKKTAIATIINSILRTFAYIIFIDRLDVVMLLYIEACLCGLFLAQGLYIYFRFNKDLFADEPGTGGDVHSKRMIRYGLLSAINELGVGIVGRTSDYFIVAAMSNPYHIGLFAFSHKLYSIIFRILPYKDFQTIIRPLFFKKYADNKYDLDSFRNIYAFMIKILLPVYILPAIYFVFFGKHIINIVFDPKYSSAYWVTLIILSSNIFLALFYPLGLTVMLKEKMEFNLYSKVIIVFSGFAGVYGMKYFGILGVAVASLLGSLFKNLIILFFMRGYPEIKYRFKDYRNFFLMIPFLIPFTVVHHLSLGIFSLILTTASFFLYVIVLFAILHPYNGFDQQMLKKLAANVPFVLSVKRSIYPYIQKVRVKIAVE